MTHRTINQEFEDEPSPRRSQAKPSDPAKPAKPGSRRGKRSGKHSTASAEEAKPSSPSVGIVKRPRGRPPKYTDALANEILERLSQGEPLTSICRDEHMPNVSTVFYWEKIIDGFSNKITRAREYSADYFSYEIKEIADTPQIGEMLTTKPLLDKGGKPVFDEKGKPILIVERKVADMIEHRKLRIETRIKLMQMLKRKTYGNNPQADEGARTMIVPLPAAYIEAVNRALGFTGKLEPLGDGQVIEGRVSDVLPE